MPIIKTDMHRIKKRYVCAAALILCGAFPLTALGEKTLLVGGSAGWDAMTTLDGVAQTGGARPYPVLILAPRVDQDAEDETDLLLSFDEGSAGLFADSAGHYHIETTVGISAADRDLARFGRGAARFNGIAQIGASTIGTEAPLVIRPQKGALFAPGSINGDFSIEFWLYPIVIEQGTQILTWSSTLSGYTMQRVRCIIQRNRLQWYFSNFFAPDRTSRPDGSTYVLTGAPLLPRKWSHHLIRYDSETGLLEYLVDGSVEALEYLNSTGAEGGEPKVPVLGKDGSFVLGGRYTGLLDEFRILSVFKETASLSRYPGAGGRAESRTIDLGADSILLRLDAAGGRNSPSGKYLYAGQGALRFEDASAVTFFIRVSEHPYDWSASRWIPCVPGEDLPEGIGGRYLRLACTLYPSADNASSPYLEKIALLYRTIDPPLPPSHLRARASDGAVDLSWDAAKSANLKGYLLYYGEGSGEYLGTGAIVDGKPAPSPIDLGRASAVRLEGLKNGKLYFFALAAYAALPAEIKAGDFSREAAARPLAR
ncbi:MAG: hypothetical protein LBR16_04365 [Treponema sp.]|jgi:hypothetical protein|nr:hypothetical protein [Treponema sp.]